MVFFAMSVLLTIGHFSAHPGASHRVRQLPDQLIAHVQKQHVCATQRPGRRRGNVDLNEHSAFFFAPGLPGTPEDEAGAILRQ
jgi:hypothetical protein